jgi:DNA modification methylase
MFSFVGDTVFDPFMGTASTQVAAARCGRNSIGVEVDEAYFKMAHDRVRDETAGLFSSVEVIAHDGKKPLETKPR